MPVCMDVVCLLVLSRISGECDCVHVMKSWFACAPLVQIGCAWRVVRCMVRLCLYGHVGDIHVAKSCCGITGTIKIWDTREHNV